jgi:hypothetical protein
MLHEQTTIIGPLICLRGAQRRKNSRTFSCIMPVKPLPAWHAALQLPEPHLRVDDCEGETYRDVFVMLGTVDVSLIGSTRILYSTQGPIVWLIDVSTLGFTFRADRRVKPRRFGRY